MSYRYMETVLGPKFTVVIPCFNEGKYVGGLLDDLRNQTVQADFIVVADCASEDDTVEVARRFEDELPLKIVQSMRRSPAAARNSAVAAIDANPEDYMVFVDADMRLPADFLERLRATTQKHPVDFLTPKFVSDGKHRVGTMSLRNVNVYNRYVITRRHKVAGIGGVMIVRKGMHDQVGGFPEDVVADDMWYVARLNHANATAYYADGIYAVNSSRRLHEDGVVKWLLDIMPEKSLVSKVHGKLSRGGSQRRYGHYGRKTKV